MFQYRSKSFENKKTQTSINYSFPPSDFTLPDSNLRINEHLTKRPKIKSFQLLPFPLFTINELTTALTTPLSLPKTYIPHQLSRAIKGEPLSN